MYNRHSISDAIGPAVPRLSVERFVTHILPPLHPTLADAVEPIFHHLCIQDADGYSLRRKGWVSLLAADPNSRATTPKEAEIRAFEGLVAVAGAIERAVFAVVRSPPAQTMRFHNTSNTAPLASWRVASHRPDGHFLLCKRPLQDAHAARSQWMFVGPTGEYSPERDARNNACRILWNMYRTLHDDPQRRFAFAFSVERTKMRLWFANRGEVLVSDAFDFMCSPALLIRFFLTFLYGTPEAMGWDPTLACIPGSCPMQYRITVNDVAGYRHVYKTVGIESSVGADVLCGRGTRTWRAVRCDPETLEGFGDEVVLKDCWMNEEAMQEGDVIRTLDNLAIRRVAALKRQIDGLRDTAPEEDSKEVRLLRDHLVAAESLAASLLTPVIHGAVILPGRRDVDATLDRDVVLLDEDGNGVPWDYIFEKTEDDTLSAIDLLQGRRRWGSWDHRYIPPQIPFLHDPKYHYRIVYEEVCAPLHQVNRLDLIFAHLANATRALRGLHEVGWVHRAISESNILVTARGDVKISGWKFAKEFDTDHAAATSDIRTGIDRFMSVEVNFCQYLFIPKLTPRMAYSCTGEVVQLSGDTGLARSSLPFWAYNPLHDVESVLWLTKFFIENHDVIFISKQDGLELDEASMHNLGIAQDTPSAPREARLAAQYNQVVGIFHRTYRRENELTHARETPDRFHIHPGLDPQKIYDDIEALRSILVSRYHEIEKGFVQPTPIPFQHKPELYWTFVGALRALGKTVEAVPAHVRLVPLLDETGV